MLSLDGDIPASLWTSVAVVCGKPGAAWGLEAQGGWSCVCSWSKKDAEFCERVNEGKKGTWKAKRAIWKWMLTGRSRRTLSFFPAVQLHVVWKKAELL